MTAPEIPQPLAKIFKAYLDANAYDVNALRDALATGQIPAETQRLFREQLADAIFKRTLTPQQYKALTGDNEYTTPEDLEAGLRQLWDRLYTDGPAGTASNRGR